MNQDLFALKGTIIYSSDADNLSITENGYVLCQDGICQGVFPQLPEEYRGIPVRDCHQSLIIPGMSDLHTHAPQNTYRGLGMDMELLDWLDTITFPEESRYEDPAYAQDCYRLFTDELVKSETTRAAIFATVHVPATLLLMELLEESGLITRVGKLCMDRLTPDPLREVSTAQSLADTRSYIEKARERFCRTFPIITPRFTVSCTDELMKGLGELACEYHLPVQSHLSENPGEIALVQELCPDTHFYGESYDRYGLFGGGDYAAIMAHCVYSTRQEIDLMKERGVFIAHCPQSNTNIASGIAPARTYLDEGFHIGLATDVAGGSSLSMLQAMADAISVSKLRWRLLDRSLRPLTLENAFYMATVGSGAFFGKVGSFEKGYDFDAVILSDEALPTPYALRPRDRLERLVYLSAPSKVTGKYVLGRKLF